MGTQKVFEKEEAGHKSQSRRIVGRQSQCQGGEIRWRADGGYEEEDFVRQRSKVQEECCGICERHSVHHMDCSERHKTNSMVSPTTVIWDLLRWDVPCLVHGPEVAWPRIGVFTVSAGSWEVRLLTQWSLRGALLWTENTAGGSKEAAALMRTVLG